MWYSFSLPPAVEFPIGSIHTFHYLHYSTQYSYIPISPHNYPTTFVQMTLLSLQKYDDEVVEHDSSSTYPADDHITIYVWILIGRLNVWLDKLLKSVVDDNRAQNIQIKCWLCRAEEREGMDTSSTSSSISFSDVGKFCHSDYACG